MSMLTPRGMGGQYKITGKTYPRMTQRRRIVPIVLASLTALVVTAGGAWGVYHFTADDDSTTAAACASASPTPTTPPVVLPDAKTITVNVYNATKKQGLAKNVADALKARGFVVGKVTNDPLQEADKSRVVPGPAEIRHGFPGKDQAKVVGAQVPAPPPAAVVEDARTDTTVDLVIGDGFQALGTPEQAAQQLLPPPPPPAPAPTGKDAKKC
jgi:hypothetical protein